MNRKEAMEMAVEIVDKWCNAPAKSNGYAVDCCWPPTLSERTRAVKKLAEFLWDAEDDVEAVGTYHTLSGKEVRLEGAPE